MEEEAVGFFNYLIETVGGRVDVAVVALTAHTHGQSANVFSNAFAKGSSSQNVYVILSTLETTR